jgi:hypothetical protein
MAGPDDHPHVRQAAGALLPVRKISPKLKIIFREKNHFFGQFNLF